MEIILNQEEVEALLREALAARGTTVPVAAEMKIRTNNKRGTFRVVFAERPGESGDRG